MGIILAAIQGTALLLRGYSVDYLRMPISAPVSTDSASLDSISPSTIIRPVRPSVAAAPPLLLVLLAYRLDSMREVTVPLRPSRYPLQEPWKASFACGSADTVPATDPRTRKRKKKNPPHLAVHIIKLQVSLRLQDQPVLCCTRLVPGAYRPR